MWTAVLLRGLAVYLESDPKKQPVSSRKAPFKLKEQLLPGGDGAAHQILQVVAAAARERIHSPLELPGHLRDPRQPQIRLDLSRVFHRRSVLMEVFLEATCSLVVRPLDTR